jgi:hypothetical protein
MSYDRTALGETERRRKAGRPKLRWLACIEDDLISAGVKTWRKKVPDICMGFHSEGGTGYTTGIACH